LARPSGPFLSRKRAAASGVMVTYSSRYGIRGRVSSWLKQVCGETVDIRALVMGVAPFRVGRNAKVCDSAYPVALSPTIRRGKRPVGFRTGSHVRTMQPSKY